MKQVFPTRLPLLLRRGSRITLVIALLAVTLGFSTFALAPTAHATTATPAVPEPGGPVRQNACNPQVGFACVTIWATDVHVHSSVPHSCLAHPSLSCKVVGTLAGGHERVAANCQEQGQTVSYAGYTSSWWTLLYADNGNVGMTSNVFIVGGVKISGVQDCAVAPDNP